MATTVGDIMTRDVLTLALGSDLSLADDVMRLERVRHLPVLDGKKLVGIVSHRDLLRAHSRLLVKAAMLPATGETQVVTVSVDEVMQSKVRTVTEDAPAKEAARLILDNRFGCLPVVEGDRLVGIVTEVDFLRWAITKLADDD